MGCVASNQEKERRHLERMSQIQADFELKKLQLENEKIKKEHDRDREIMSRKHIKNWMKILNNVIKEHNFNVRVKTVSINNLIVVPVRYSSIPYELHYNPQGKETNIQYLPIRDKKIIGDISILVETYCQLISGCYIGKYDDEDNESSSEF
jgi:hypothetical protein